MIIPPYKSFVEWCRTQHRPIAIKAVSIADNADGNNRQGHLMRGYLAAASFLRQNPEMRAWLLQTRPAVKRPVDIQDPRFLSAWQIFLDRNKRQHSILRRILPEALGGQTISGGGGAYPFKIALRLAADYLDEIREGDIPAFDEKADRYRLVRKREYDRDSSLVDELKRLYDYRCQVCGHTIQLERDRFYCQGHHLRPLGGGHHGKDDPSNILILCPNHHAEFDFFLIAILDLRGRCRKIEHIQRDLDPSECHITIRHTIAKENIEYATEQFLIRLDRYFS